MRMSVKDGVVKDRDEKASWNAEKYNSETDFKKGNTVEEMGHLQGMEHEDPEEDTAAAADKGREEEMSSGEKFPVKIAGILQGGSGKAMWRRSRKNSYTAVSLAPVFKWNNRKGPIKFSQLRPTG